MGISLIALEGYLNKGKITPKQFEDFCYDKLGKLGELDSAEANVLLAHRYITDEQFADICIREESTILPAELERVSEKKQDYEREADIVMK